MRKLMPFAALSLLAFAFVTPAALADNAPSALAATPSPAGAKVFIVEPKDGAVVTSPFKVVFGISGMQVAPAGTQTANTGHHHLLIDNPQVNMGKPLPATAQIKHFGKGQTETTLTLAPGQHTLQLLFADWKHQPFNPSVESEKITITVK